MTSTGAASPGIAILCPTGRDAELTRKVLGEAGVACEVCLDIRALCATIDDEIGAMVVSDEALLPEIAFELLAQTLRRQPQMVRHSRDGADRTRREFARGAAGTRTTGQRHVARKAASHCGAGQQRAALRARQRQYQIRAHLAEREQSEHALREAGRRKDEFLATLAHELRNPLAPISNAAYLMGRVQKEGALQAAREIIERQVWHLARLVEDLLDVSREFREKSIFASVV